jgi:hypothetical protein
LNGPALKRCNSVTIDGFPDEFGAFTVVASSGDINAAVAFQVTNNLVIALAKGLLVHHDIFIRLRYRHLSRLFYIDRLRFAYPQFGTRASSHQTQPRRLAEPMLVHRGHMTAHA